MFESFGKTGCRVELKDQSERGFPLEKLVSSLTSFSSSNRDLGRFLQENGYLRFIDFIMDSKIDKKIKENRSIRSGMNPSKEVQRWRNFLFLKNEPVN